MRTCKTLPVLVALALAPLTVAAAQENVVPQRLLETMGGSALPTKPTDVALAARLADGAARIETGLRWTIYAREGDAVGEFVGSHDGGAFEAVLEPGPYVAHVAYAGTTTVARFDVAANGPNDHDVTLDLGAMRLTARSGKRSLPTDDSVTFAIHEREGDRKPIRHGIAPGETVLLPAGIYRAVVRYGEHNAVTGADIRVHPGEVTEAVLGVQGARVSLALVRRPNAAAAIATVTWRVFDSGGKPLLQTDEPTPSLVLAPGSYTAEVLHGDWTSVHRFEVELNEPLDVRIPLESG